MTKIAPRVSVYIVNHNYGRFLERAIESVLSQTMENYELLIIDNGSTDNSRTIIERYAQLPNVVAILQENVTLSATNNIALDRARGDYIVRLDADDFLDEHFLGILSGRLDKNPNVGLVFPDYYLTDAEGNTLEHIRRHDFDHVTLLDQPAHGACTMIRRDCLITLNGYDESYTCQDGWDLWVRFIKRFGVENVNLPLFYYRQHHNNLTKNEKHLHATRAQILKQNANREKNVFHCVAVVPVRGAQLDPRQQALRPIAGRPLIEWTVDAALGVQRVTHVIVTSPDKAVLKHIEMRYGGTVVTIERAWNLAIPNVPLSETLTHAFEHFPENCREFDSIAILPIESPFRTARHIDMALDVMDIFETNRVFGVRKENDNFFCHSGSGLSPLRHTSFLRREPEELYRQAGDLLVLRRGHLFSETDEDVRVGHVDLNASAAFGVYTDLDWQIAETIAAVEFGEKAGPKLPEIHERTDTRCANLLKTSRKK